MRPAFAASLFVSLLACRPAPPPPVLSPIPPFQMQNQEGRPFGAAQLQGKPWVADFIYTECKDSCPQLTARMADLQKRLPPSVQLVSFTVDPKRDTPEKLQAYATSAGADPQRWHFLTGPPELVKYLLGTGFKVTLLEESEQGVRNLVHDEHLVLVDGIGRIRGYYEAEADAQKRLRRDAEALLKEP